MRSCCLLPIAALLAGCHPANGGRQEDAQTEAQPPDTPLRPASPAPAAATGEWTGDGGRLTYTDAASGRAQMALTCSHGGLLVRLPGVNTIASEERLSFGGGGDVEILVADTAAGPAEVRALGPAPEGGRMKAMLKAGPGASYGAVAIGPLVPVADVQAAAFIAACR